jgi:isocitrate/isopropylmalate dehydrogenase
MRFDGLVHSPFTISEGVEVDLLIVQGDGIGPEITSATRKNQKMSDAAAVFTRAVNRLIGSPDTRTRDLGGRLGTKAFADAVARSVLNEKA